MLDGQAPNIEVIANRNDDIDLSLAVSTDPLRYLKDKTYNKASIYPNGYSQHTEYICNLVSAVAECTWPSNSDIPLQERTQAVEHAICKRQDEDVLIGKVEFDEMCGNHLTHRVCVYETGEEDKRHEMVVKDFGVEV